jgi:transposase InsO family protein
MPDGSFWGDAGHLSVVCGLLGVMPLKVMDMVELRLQVIAEVLSGVSPREAAVRHGIGKSQVYVWLARYRADGAEGLVPRSRRPRSSPGRLDGAVEDAIVRHRRDRPRWGAKKIRSMLAREGYPVPAVSTVHQVLVRRGLVDRTVASREPPGGWQRFTRPSCNDLWHIDATRHALAGGRGFWVLDLVDDHSRCLVAAHVAAAPTMEAGWAAFRGAVAAYGLPRQLLSDNGLNFTGRFHGTSVAFERQVTAAGTQLIHSRARHPQTLGKLERQHATQNDWITDHRRPRSLAAAQTVLDAYREDYNTARPHEAIGQRFPAECYLPDPGISLPVIELAPADPYPPGCLMRKVRASGDFRYSTACLPLDIRWAGIQVGLIREHGRLLVYYGAALIDTLIIGDLPEPQNRR